MSNLGNFKFDVPTLEGFSDLESQDEDVRAIESFFDNKDDDQTPFPAISDVENFFSPLSSPFVQEVRPTSTMKKSMSTSCLLPGLKKNTSDVSNQFKKLNATRSNAGTRKTCSNKSASTSKLFSNENSQFISTAEAVYKFQNRTPIRFHKGPLGNKPLIEKISKPTMTIPHSPALATKNRHRMTTVISSEAKEFKDFEEAQLHKFKALPLNTKILAQADTMATIKKKTPTKIEPFNITEMQRKVIAEEPRYEFHARPVSEYVLKPPAPLIKANITTQAITPSFVRKHNEKFKQIKKHETKDEKKQPMKPVRLVATVPMPFSFEKRDVETQVKKEQKIQMIFEEEKKMKEFHARPVPKKILESPTIVPRKTFFSHSNLSIKSDDTDSTTSSVFKPSINGFKARPASVLKAKPFIPKKIERPLLEIVNVPLHSERRAADRAQYEQQQRENDKIMAELIQKRMEEERKIEEAEIKKIRSEREHVAQPIRKYKELKKINPKPPTTPKSPNFASAKLNNKENTLE